jgi:hypothetical protein
MARTKLAELSPGRQLAVLVIVATACGVLEWSLGRLLPPSPSAMAYLFAVVLAVSAGQ